MILYYSDWEYYPKAIVDTETTNKTFVQISGLLKLMGVENHAFMLALHDPTLQGVDPFDPDITKETILKILTEVKVNPWYYFREIARAPASGGSDPIMFKATRANISQIWLFFNHITTILIQPRQTGKSFGTDVLNNGIGGLFCKSTKTFLFTKDDDLRRINIKRLKDIYAELPYYLNIKNRSDANNTETITFNAFNNIYITAVAQASEKLARSVGRGMTLHIVHVDEIAYITNIELSLSPLLAAAGAGREIAAEAGGMYGTMFTTTPGFLSSDSGAFVYKELYQKAMKWSEKLFDLKNEEELRQVVKKQSKVGVVLLEYNHRQLGKTDQWLQDRIADAISSGENALADYLNMWPEGNEVSPFSKDLIKKVNDSLVNEPFSEITDHGYILRWYCREKDIPNVSNRYLVIGLDTSNAIGKDDIAMVIRDIKTGAVIAVGQYNETNTITFSEWLAELFIRFPNMVMVIEAKSTGFSIIENLLKLLPAMSIDPFKRLFNWILDEASEHRERLKEININDRILNRNNYVYDKYRKYFGYTTTGSGKQSRDVLYGEVILASLKYTGDKVYDAALIKQISDLKSKNGRIDHATYSKDDLVIAWLLTYWFLTKARNKELYDIPSNTVLSVVISTELSKDGNKEKIEKQNYQLALKEKIDSLLEELRRADDIQSLMIINKIRYLSDEIDTDYVPSFNINDAIEKIRMDKRESKYTRWNNTNKDVEDSYQLPTKQNKRSTAFNGNMFTSNRNTNIIML